MNAIPGHIRSRSCSRSSHTPRRAAARRSICPRAERWRRLRPEGGQMAKTRTARPAMPDDALQELMDLLAGSDSVELKLTVPDSDIRSTAVALGMDPLDAQLRQVFFFDTPALDLDRAGVVVRARRIQGKGADAVVKLRPVVPSQLPAPLRALEGFGVEVDAMPGG